MGEAGHQIQPLTRRHRLQPLADEALTEAGQGLHVDAVIGRHHMLSHPGVRLSIHVGDIEFLAREDASAAEALHQFVEMRLAQAARIAHVILRFRIAQNHPHAWSFAPVHRAFLAQGRVDRIGVPMARQAGVGLEGAAIVVGQGHGGPGLEPGGSGLSVAVVARARCRQIAAGMDPGLSGLRRQTPDRSSPSPPPRSRTAGGGWPHGWRSGSPPGGCRRRCR